MMKNTNIKEALEEATELIRGADYPSCDINNYEQRRDEGLKKWCEPIQNPTGPETGSYRVLRGGSWGFSAQFLRSAVRFDGSPELRSVNIGFRLVRTPLPSALLHSSPLQGRIEAALATAREALKKIEEILK